MIKMSTISIAKQNKNCNKRFECNQLSL